MDKEQQKNFNRARSAVSPLSFSVDSIRPPKANITSQNINLPRPRRRPPVQGPQRPPAQEAPQRAITVAREPNGGTGAINTIPQIQRTPAQKTQVSNVIPAQVLGQSNRVTTVPEVQMPMSPMDGLNRRTDELLKERQSALEQARRPVSLAEERLQRLMGQSSNQFEDFQAMTREQGIPQLTDEYNTVLETIQDRRAQYDRLIAGQEGQGRGLTVGQVTGLQGAIQRQKEVEIGTRVAEAELLGNRINQAKNTIRETLDYKYGAIQAEIQNEMIMLDRFDQNLSKAEQDLKEARQQELQLAMTEIEEMKSEEAQIFEMAAQAKQMGGTDADVQRILQSASLGEALQVMPQATTSGPAGNFQFTDGFIFNKDTGEITKAPVSNSGEVAKAQSAVNELSTTLSLMEDIQNSPHKVFGLAAAATRRAAANGLVTPQSDWLAKVDQLSNKLLFENLGKMTGVLTDRDLEVLRGEQSTIGTPLTEAGFEKELNRIQGLFENSFNEKQSLLKQQSGTPERPLVIDRFIERYPNSTASELYEIYEEAQLELGGTTSFNRGGGNLPQQNNNPGNVKRSGLSDRFAMKDANGVPMTDSQGHLIFATPEDGFAALAADINAKVSGQSAAAQRKLGKQAETIAELNEVYAEDPNWKNNVASILGVPVNTNLQSIPRERLIQAIMRAEGYFA